MVHQSTAPDACTARTVKRLGWLYCTSLLRPANDAQQHFASSYPCSAKEIV